MGKNDTYLSELRNRKLFNEKHEGLSTEDLTRENLYLQSQQLVVQSKTQKDIRIMLIIGIVIIALNVIGYVLLFIGESLFD